MQDQRIGTVLDDRYRIIERIAAGGMGVVYRGERVKLGRGVAIKFLHAWMAADESFIKRFEVEARAMAKLQHPNCASVIDFGVDGEEPYVVMDLVAGESLRNLLERERLPVSRAIEIIRQVLSGLAHAHKQGITHRDIKPDNIMVDASPEFGDQVRILDFGLAKMREGATGLTTGFVVGTPDYMAPEQTLAQAVDARTDVYAVGVMLFEMLTGMIPFRAEYAHDVMRMHREDAPPRLFDRAPEAGFSAELEAVVARALAKTPADRYLSAAEFATALDATPEATSTRKSGSMAVSTPAAPRLESQPQALGVAATAVLHSDALIPVNAAATPFATGMSAPMSASATMPISASSVQVVAHGPAGSGVQPAVAAAPYASYPGAVPPGASHTDPAGSMPPMAPPGTGAYMPPSGAYVAPGGPPQPPPSGAFAAFGGPQPPPSGAFAAVPGGPQTAPSSSGLHAGPPSGMYAQPGPSVQPAPAAASRRKLLVAGAGLGAIAVIAIVAVAAGGSSNEAPAQALLTVQEAPKQAEPQVAANPTETKTPSQEADTPPADTEPTEANIVPASGDEPPEFTAIKPKLKGGDTPSSVVKALHKIGRKYPKNAEIQYTLGQLYFSKLWVKDGLEAFREAILLNPAYRSDSRLIKSTINGLGNDKYHYHVRRFLVREVGKPAVPYLEEVLAGSWREQVKDRASATLRDIK